MINKDAKKTELTDNRPKALADALTSVYKYAIPSLSSQLSRDRILSYSKDVAELKSLKRY